MARSKAKPDWDISAEPPDYRTPRDRSLRNVPADYSPSTNKTQADTGRRMAAAVAKKRRNYVNGRVFEDGKLIGTAPSDDSGITRRVKPRSLRVRGVS